MLKEELGVSLHSSLHVAASLKPRAAELVGEVLHTPQDNKKLFSLVGL